MRTTLITAPAVEPLSLSETKEHLRVDFSDDDTLITNLIISARETFESKLGRQLITATWRGFLDQFPWSCEAIEVAKPPLLSVSSITYVDSAGVTQVWDLAEYDVQVFSGPLAQRGMISPKPDFWYPTTRRVPNAITINFDAGYGPDATDVPNEIKQMLFGWIGHLYKHRETYMTGGAIIRVPGIGFEGAEEVDFA